MISVSCFSCAKLFLNKKKSFVSHIFAAFAIEQQLITINTCLQNVLISYLLMTRTFCANVKTTLKKSFGKSTFKSQPKLQICTNLKLVQQDRLWFFFYCPIRLYLSELYNALDWCQDSCLFCSKLLLHLKQSYYPLYIPIEHRNALWHSGSHVKRMRFCWELFWIL